MRIDREYFIRFAVAVALACYDLPTDRAMTSEEAAQLVKWVIDMALGPDASNVQVEPMENYPASSKMPLIISMAGVQQHLFLRHDCLVRQKVLILHNDLMTEIRSIGLTGGSCNGS